MMATLSVNAGSVNWVIEDPSAYGTGIWGFLIQGGADDISNLGAVLPVGIPPEGGLMGGYTGDPILSWNGEKLVYNGGGVVSGIAMIGTADFAAAYTVIHDNYPSVISDNGSIQVADSTTGTQEVYNRREFSKIDTPDWTPEEGYFYMLLFDWANGKYAYVTPLQVNDPAFTGQYVVDGDIAPDGLGSGYIDPYFPSGDDVLVWFEIAGWPGPGEGSAGDFGNPGFWGTWDNPSVVPEPTTATLLALGCAVFGLRRRFRR